MRCLVVADLHYSLPQYDWLVNVADSFDLVIIAGDHLDLSSPVDFRAQAMVVAKYLELIRHKTRVFVCSGNHDLDMRDPSGEKVARWVGALNGDGVPSDGITLEVDDLLFTICPWWDGPAAQAGIAEQLATASTARGSRWIWIYHAPPDASPTSWSGSRSFGDKALSDWIRQHQPDLVLSGHVHQSPFVKGGSWVDKIGKTWVFNTGHQFGAPPAHIVFDTAKEEAFWMSAAGIQSIRFDAPLERPLPRLARPPEWFTFPDPAGGPIRA